MRTYQVWTYLLLSHFLVTILVNFVIDNPENVKASTTCAEYAKPVINLVQFNCDSAVP